VRKGSEKGGSFDTTDYEGRRPIKPPTRLGDDSSGDSSVEDIDVPVTSAYARNVATAGPRHRLSSDLPPAPKVPCLTHKFRQSTSASQKSRKNVSRTSAGLPKLGSSSSDSGPCDADINLSSVRVDVHSMRIIYVVLCTTQMLLCKCVHVHF
jgi:hypothetical protein